MHKRKVKVTLLETNLLKAIKNIVSSRNNSIIAIYKSHTRINSVGDALEYYIKDIFCNTLKSGIKEKEKAYTNAFSYLGNQNNPPDFIIKKSDAIEVKKIEGRASSIALNSSYPKDKLHSDDRFIINACKNCESSWSTKDYLYIIGTVVDSKLKLLWMLYGDCYAAEREVYERIRLVIKNGVSEINGPSFSETNELGKVKKVDPLGITDLRIRGMWHIEHPVKVFDYLDSLVNYNERDEFVLYTLMSKKKYMSFPKEDQDAIESLRKQGLSTEEVEIKDPNNPAKRIIAVLIKFSY